MVSKHFTVPNAQGFHMRPATTFAKVGSEIDVVCDGEGENEALAEAAEMIESGFGE